MKHAENIQVSDLPRITQREVARRAWRESDLSLKDAKEGVRATYKAITQLLMEKASPECRIVMGDVGTLMITKRRANPSAMDPRSGIQTFIPSKRDVKFKPSNKIQSFIDEPLLLHGHKPPEGAADEHFYDNIPRFRELLDGNKVIKFPERNIRNGDSAKIPE